MNESLVGKKFGMYLVLQEKGRDKHYKLQYDCKCDCGAIKTVLEANLLKGKATKCRKCGYKGNRLSKAEAGFKSLLANYKHNAKKRNFKFELTKEEFRNITLQNCYYCGIEPSLEHLRNKTTKYQEKDSFDHSVYIHNGIDRLDSSKGYLKENCVPCCKTCNQAKSNYTMEYFLNWINRIYKNLNKEEK